MTEFDLKYNIVDEITPPNVPLRAHYKKSFAYYTIRERLPVILTQIVDYLSRAKDSITADLGGDERIKDDIKEIQGNISQLKYELQTDKKFRTFNGNDTDRKEWNDFLSTLGEDNSYFTSTWLYTECYMYRRLKSLFEESTFLKDFDYFRHQKQNALTSFYETIISVVAHVEKLIAQIQQTTDEQEKQTKLQEYFIKILKLSLWGNRCDLSISQGKEIKPTDDPFSALESLDKFILVDCSNLVWQCIEQKHKEQQKSTKAQTFIIDIVQDNSGYELFTDLLMANFLIELNLVDKIRFHIKAIPWFISDVMPFDFDWTIRTLAEHSNTYLSKFGQKLLAHLAEQRFELCPVEYFWTSPYEFYRMQSVNQKLYDKLCESYLVIFKGDLNYRKLLGDFNWSYTASFDEVLRGFKPANICSLRTVKADLICELKDGVADELSKIDPMWMETGQYGLIHFSPL